MRDFGENSDETFYKLRGRYLRVSWPFDYDDYKVEDSKKRYWEVKCS